MGLLGSQKPKILTDGGTDETDETPEESETPEGSVARAESLTGLVDQTLEGQLERQEVHNKEKRRKESQAAEESQGLIDNYEQLKSEVGAAIEWDLSLDTAAGELVEDLTHDGEVDLRDYSERQSNQIEGLTGTIRRFSSMIDSKEEDIEERRSRLEELQEEESSELEDLMGQIEAMDDEDLQEDQNFSDFHDSERKAVKSHYETAQEEVQTEIDDLQEAKRELLETKSEAASERDTRRSETQEVYDAVAGRAEANVEENTDELRDALTVLRALESQQELHNDKSVAASNEASTLSQGQETVAETRAETGLAYVTVALDAVDEMESAIKAHDRFAEGLSEATQVEVRDLEGIYDELVDSDSVDEDIDPGEYGFDVLRQRVLEAAGTITSDSYDSVREIRDIADDLDGYREGE